MTPIDAAAVSTVEAAMAEPELALVDDAHEDGTDPDDADEADPSIIDLDRPARAEEPTRTRAWQQVALEPEPDSVDHVLQALINRARFKQVGVEEVATELVERADLRGEEVSDVLAELVGRADAPGARSPTGRASWSCSTTRCRAVPGQLTDFAKLAPADKKRIIIRVLCLLVARSEDQQLPAAGRRRDARRPRGRWPGRCGRWPRSRRRRRRRPAEPPGQVGLTRPSPS